MVTGQTAVAPELRYDDERHEYLDASTGEVLPHITGMLVKTGHVDTRWFTDESRNRGTDVHRLTLDYDLDALPLAANTWYRPRLLAWASVKRILGAKWSHLEEPFIHPTMRFGGCPDRAGEVWKLKSVVEIKTGPFHKSHLVQTALQAFLLAGELELPPEAIARFAVYLKPDGKFKVEHFIDRKDFREARAVIKHCCEV